MQLEIKNHTDFSTLDLRRLVMSLMKNEFPAKAKLAVTVEVKHAPLQRRTHAASYHWRAMIGGALHGGIRALLTLKLAKPGEAIDWRRVAADLRWCLGAVHGLKRRHMQGLSSYDSSLSSVGSTYGWVEVRYQPKAEPSREEQVERELQHVRAKLKESATRLKRAMNLVEKWKKKEARLLFKLDKLKTPPVIAEVDAEDDEELQPSA